MGFSAIAQQRIMKNDIREAVASSKKELAGKELPSTSAATFAPQTATSVVINRYESMDDAETMYTTYDLQSNQFVANRMFQLPDGSVAITATMSHEANLTASDRGTGYNFYDGSDWGDQPEARIEAFKTGWPSIAQWGDNGEILLCHGGGNGTYSGMQCYTREVAGQGEWEFKGQLPAYPAGYPYESNYPTWPRVVTCGPHHNVIIAIATLQQSVSSDETDTRTIMWRSTDAENWEVSYSLLEDFGYETGFFSADDYCMAANGNNVAIVYSGCLTNSVWMFKSTDCGESWNATRVWEHPYEGISLEDPDLAYTDTLFMPMNTSVTIDNNGVVHMAMNTFEMAHWADTDPGYYNYFYGRSVDGILYWNDTQEAPIQSPDGNPHHAARLWWPDEENPGYVMMIPDSTRWIGFAPMYEGISWENDKYYNDNYHSKLYGTSGHPALSCDPNGNLACAFTTPCTARDNGTYYFRSIYVSYLNCEEGYWHQVEDDLMDDVMMMYSEGIYSFAAPNTYNVGEFWFGYQEDSQIGFAWGSEPTQTTTTTNNIHACKVIANNEFVNVPETEAKNVVYGIYPNPVTGNVMNVMSAMDADATITIVNLVGQTVKQFNQSLHTGDNSINIDLKSGVYFCTVKANGFNNTVKFVVK